VGLARALHARAGSAPVADPAMELARRALVTKVLRIAAISNTAENLGCDLFIPTL
jgi:hypothetical protein